MTDRELDVLVAEKVMGETVHEIVEESEEWMGTELGGSSLTMVRVFPQPRYYSTSIAAAWAVVEHLTRENGTEFWLQRFKPHTREADHAAKFGENIGSEYSFSTSPARAICLAALSAVGVKVDA